MPKIQRVFVIMLLLVFVLLFGAIGCMPSVSDSDCGTLQAELDRANTELNKLKAELGGIQGEVATVRTASLEELLRQRRSIRAYSDAPLTKDEVMKLLWAGQGITTGGGFRTAPSAGALYPLEIYLVAGNVDDLAPGIYKYSPVKNALTLVREGDVRTSLAAASLGQGSVSDGAIDIVIAAVYEGTKVKYGSRGRKKVPIEGCHGAPKIF